MRIIGISGWAGSGKDEAATQIQVLLNSEQVCCVRYSMANPIKDMAYYAGWNGQKDKRGRQLLIEIGMSGRRYDPYCWINRAKRKLEWWPGKTVVIPDIRFDNEFRWLADDPHNLLLRIIRPGVEQIDHVSEQELDDHTFDYEIINDGDIDRLRQQLRVVLELEGFLDTVKT